MAAIWSRLTAFVTGGAVATAAADAIKPEFEPLQQTAWKNAPYKVIDPDKAAHLRARQTDTNLPGINPKGVNYADDAARSGVGSNRFDLLTELARTWPGVAQLIDLRRRNQANDTSGITDPEMTNALRRTGYTAEMIAAIKDLVAAPLSLGEVAAAIHRGLIPDTGGLLKGEQPEPPFSVEAYPVYPIDPVAEAKKHGADLNQLGVLVGLQGLPMGVIEAAHAYYRGDITHGDYIRAFNESNNRNEWADAVLKYARQIPTARDYIENALRGYRTFDEAAKGAARHGMSRDDALTIFQNSGRPLNLHQITQALAWGATYQPAPADNPNPWRQAVLLGAVRPEYYDMQETLKYNLPSAFFFRVLQQQQVLTTEEAVTWYKRLGWPPELAMKVAEAFGAAPTDEQTPYVKRAETQLWSKTHAAYLVDDATEQDALDMLTILNIPPEDQSAIIGLWTNERNLTRARLTATQLKKAFAKAVENPLTGQPWTEAEVLDELHDRGWNAQDAQTFLNLPAK